MNKKTLLSAVLVLSLASCNFNNNNQSSNGNSDFLSSNSNNEESATNSSQSDESQSLNSNNESNFESEIIGSEESTFENTSESALESESESTSKSESESNTVSESFSEIIDNTPKYFDFYSINDFHGRVDENASSYEPGISKLATFLKNEKAKNEDGYVFINNGDLWQDTYSSGYNKGQLLTECMEAMECEVMSLGNHEFDWGISNIAYNQTLAPNTTFLCANLNEYPDTSKKSDLTKSYKVIERNGTKIGIIGTIGSTQNTSITSSNWESLSFLDTTLIVKQLSNELRTEKGCDIVVWENHASYDESNYDEVTKVSPISNKKYVDAVFNGHTHQTENYETNGVAFIQAGCHGREVGHVQLKLENGEVSTILAEEDLGFNRIKNCATDSTIDSIISKYYTEDYLATTSTTIGTIKSSGYSSTISKQAGGSLLAKATYDLYPEEMKDVDIVINNGGRNTGTAGAMTREDIFNMLPFTNYTMVCSKIKGKDIINELNYSSNMYYKPDASLEIDENSYYTVACIDYLLIHKNAYRKYDYFSSYNADNVQYTITDYSVDIVSNYLAQKKTINLSDYQTANFRQ